MKCFNEGYFALAWKSARVVVQLKSSDRFVQHHQSSLGIWKSNSEDNNGQTWGENISSVSCRINRLEVNLFKVHVIILFYAITLVRLDELCIWRRCFESIKTCCKVIAVETP